MSKFTFDCYVCNETLKTDDSAKLIRFAKEHEKCGDES